MMRIFKMKKIFYLAIIIGLFILPLNFALAASQIISKEVSGIGQSKELAIINGLIEAIRQVHGVEIDSMRETRSNFEENYQDRNGKSSNNTSASASQRQKILSSTKGYIKSYDVLHSDRLENGSGWEVLLLVNLVKYKPVGVNRDNSRMRTMAIMPFRVQAPYYMSSGRKIPAMEVSRQFTQRLISEMTQACKFRVLDREYTAEMVNERNILRSGEVPITEMVRLGQKLGADYMVVGSISEYSIDEKNKQYSGVKTKQRQATLVVDYRVIEVAPQEIRWSNTVDQYFDNRELRNIGVRDNASQAHHAIFSHAGASIVSEILDVIYPIKVMSASSPQSVYLNQGGIRVKQGELFDIFTPGQKFVDPDTGLKIRVDGHKTATIQIASVLPKYCIGQVVEGNFSNIKKRAICRRKAADSREIKQNIRPMTAGSSDKPVNW